MFSDGGLVVNEAWAQFMTGNPHRKGNLPVALAPAGSPTRFFLGDTPGQILVADLMGNQTLVPVEALSAAF